MYSIEIWFGFLIKSDQVSQKQLIVFFYEGEMFILTSTCYQNLIILPHRIWAPILLNCWWSNMMGLDWNMQSNFTNIHDQIWSKCTIRFHKRFMIWFHRIYIGYDWVRQCYPIRCDENVLYDMIDLIKTFYRIFIVFIRWELIWKYDQILLQQLDYNIYIYTVLMKKTRWWHVIGKPDQSWWRYHDQMLINTRSKLINNSGQIWSGF